MINRSVKVVLTKSIKGRGHGGKQNVEEKLLEAEKLVEEFCSKFEELYEKNNLTPNMHLAAHLTDCIRNHGPVYGFWLFAL